MSVQSQTKTSSATASENIAEDLSNLPALGKAPVDRKEQVYAFLKKFRLGFLLPIVRLILWDDPQAQFKTLWDDAILPFIAFSLFLLLWHFGAKSAKSSLGVIPGPLATWEQVEVLWKDHVNERAKEAVFYERQKARNAKLKASNPARETKIIPYTGKPTFIDQIITSLKTVFAGFLLATLLSLPMGIMMGLNRNARKAINPMIQIFKPVSPVVWLLLVTMVVSATLSVNEVLGFPKSFIISFISVGLCAMWPTLVNTSVGVSSVDKNYINVARVLKLDVFKKVYKVILPASLPMIFTGMRVSVSIAWMVLIAVELLAQSPGLGKFVWDEFQNGSSSSNAKIIVAAFVIGIIGYFLDRLMIMVQKAVSFGKTEVA